MNQAQSHDYYRVKGFLKGVKLLRAMEARTVLEAQCNYNESADLVDTYGNAVYEFCRSLTYSKEDADDLFQETFLKAIEQPSKLFARENPQGFLFSTALYLWKSWKRKYARRNRLVPVVPLDETVAIGVDNIEESFVEKENIRTVRKLVDSLPDKHKIPLILFYTMELSVQDISEILKLPVGTVKSRLYKARKLIEKGLIKDGFQ